MTRFRVREEIGNLPNMITLGRVVLILPVLWFIDPVDPVSNFVAMSLFALASFFDLIDGWLARKRGLVTVFGKFVDPLADKVMVMAVLVYLVHVGLVPPWLVVVMLGRDLYMSGLRSLAVADGLVIAANEGGKLKTAFQMAGLCCVLARYRYRLPFDIWFDFHFAGLVFLYVSLVLSLLSAVQYTWVFADVARRRDRP